MEIRQSQVGAIAVLAPSGPLVGDDVEPLRQALEQARVRSLGRLVLDLAATPFVDSRGLEMLVDVSEELSGSGRVLKIAGANGLVREVLQVTDLDALFEHYADVNTAARSFL